MSGKNTIPITTDPTHVPMNPKKCSRKNYFTCLLTESATFFLLGHSDIINLLKPLYVIYPSYKAKKYSILTIEING